MQIALPIILATSRAAWDKSISALVTEQALLAVRVNVAIALAYT